jgi:hypothetical protein
MFLLPQAHSGDPSLQHQVGPQAGQGQGQQQQLGATRAQAAARQQQQQQQQAGGLLTDISIVGTAVSVKFAAVAGKGLSFASQLCAVYFVCVFDACECESHWALMLVSML